MDSRRDIAMVLADVDGTLVTEEKVLTARAQAAVQGLHRAGIRFAITSGRPPLGMAMLFEALSLDTPVAGFNGGLMTEPDLSVILQRTLASSAVEQTIDVIREQGLDVWIYRGNDWLVEDVSAPHVAREARTVEFEPEVVKDVRSAAEGVIKIVGVSDDHPRVERCKAALQQVLGREASVSRSQPYYVDVTHPDANKGAVVEYLARNFCLSPSRIATIGDQPNDVRMFERSGFSIAMGNAPPEVQAQADATTDSYRNEGFAKAMEQLILGT